MMFIRKFVGFLVTMLYIGMGMFLGYNIGEWMVRTFGLIVGSVILGTITILFFVVYWGDRIW